MKNSGGCEAGQAREAAPTFGSEAVGSLAPPAAEFFIPYSLAAAGGAKEPTSS